MHRVLAALGIGVALAVGITAYVRQPAPRVAAVDALGVRTRRPFSRHCAWFVVDARIGAWPTGEVNCTWHFHATPGGLIERNAIDYHVITRHVRSVERSWEPPSDTAWRRQADSIRGAIMARGGQPIQLQPHHLNAGEELECWQFPSFEVQMHTGQVSGGATHAVGGNSWFMFLHAGPGPLFRCDSAPAPLSNDR